MEQVEIIAADDSRWLSLIETHPQATIFHHPAWLNTISDCYHHHPFLVVIADIHGNIQAGTPVMDVHSLLTGHRWASLPFTDHCTPLCQDERCLAYFIDYFLEKYDNGDAPVIELRWEYPILPDSYRSCEYILSSLALDPDPEVIARRIDHKYRRMPRLAQERGANAVIGRTHADMELFYKLHTITRQRLGVPVQPRRFFDLLWEYLIDPGLGFLLHVFKDDDCLSSAVFLHWKDTLVYKYSASSGLERQLSPNDLLMWTAIRWGCEHGYKALDLGRTNIDQPGLRHFKRRWGAVEKPLVYTVFSAKNLEIHNGKMMKSLGALISHSPLWVCRLSGELLYGHFG